MKEETKRVTKTDGTNYRQRLQRVLWPDDIKEKDINDMILSGKTKEEIKLTIKNNTYQGNMAKIKIRNMEKK